MLEFQLRYPRGLKQTKKKPRVDNPTLNKNQEIQ